MSGVAGVLLILVFFLFVVLHVLGLAVALPRLVGMLRLLKDPRRRGALLSVETREALRAADLDPDGFSLPELNEHPDLAERVGREIAAKLRETLSGALGIFGRALMKRRAESGPAAESAATRGVGLGSERTYLGAEAPIDVRSIDPNLPPPIDAGADTGPRLAAGLLLAAAVLGFGFWWMGA